MQTHTPPNLLTDDELRQRINTAWTPQTAAEALEQAAIYREYVRRVQEGCYEEQPR